ncbi:unnamed protein product [Linum trigynum]|uniref:Uncharacterized protein n=1 Tax=Linum trigynum TaxID=586398 RepID=A0AAV2E857_9ROSI
MAYVDHAFSFTDDDLMMDGSYTNTNRPPIKEIGLALSLLVFRIIDIVVGFFMTSNRVFFDRAHGKILLSFRIPNRFILVFGLDLAGRGGGRGGLIRVWISTARVLIMAIEVLGIGVSLGVEQPMMLDWEEVEAMTTVKREDVVRAVQRVLGGDEECQAMRKRATELAGMAREAVESGGSSYENVTNDYSALWGVERRGGASSEAAL